MTPGDFSRRRRTTIFGMWCVLAGSLDARLETAINIAGTAFLARFAFELAQAFNVFYHKHHILKEEDPEKRAFLLLVTALVREQLVTTLGIAGNYSAGKDVSIVASARATKTKTDPCLRQAGFAALEMTAKSRATTPPERGRYKFKGKSAGQTPFGPAVGGRSGRAGATTSSRNPRSSGWLRPWGLWRARVCLRRPSRWRRCRDGSTACPRRIP